MRWDIINSLIEKNGYKKYLEIGYYKGWSFDRINAESKRAVDPNPCKFEMQSSYEHGSVFGYADKNEFIHKQTSDEFFEDYPNDRFDIVFIDGLHESEQVYRDIENSVKHLNDGGVIVLHDCNPPKFEHTTCGIDGCWTGDTYKAFIKWRRNHWDQVAFTVDVDWGIGVIFPFKEKDFDSQHTGILEAPTIDPWKDVPEEIDWEFFDKHRNRLLNLKSVEQFHESLSNNS